MPSPPRKPAKSIAAGLKQRALAWRQALRALRQRLPTPLKRVLRRATNWTLGSMAAVTLAIALIFAAAYYWLPLLAERKADIAAYLSDTLGNPVTLGELNTYWDGLNPGVRVQGVGIQSASTGQQALRLKEMRLSLSWVALLTGQFEINSLVLVEPSLTIERMPDGELRVRGLDNADLPTTEESDFSNLLLAQNEVVIENGELLWLDRRGDAKNPDRLLIKKVALTLHNDGDRHRFDLRADFPPDLCQECRVSATLRGNPVHDPSWRGEIIVQARGLAVPSLPLILRELLPAGVDGRFDLNLTSHWRAARPEAINGRLVVTNLRLPLPEESSPLAIQSLDTTLAWKGDSESWQLNLSELQLGLMRAPWPVGQVNLEVKPQHIRLEAEHVDLSDVVGFASRLTLDYPLLKWLRAAQPAGDLERVRVEFSGPLEAPTEYRAQAELLAVRFGAYERVPGLRGLSGELSMSEEGGEFGLNSSDLQIAMPRLLRDPLMVQRLESRIRWRQNAEDWFVQAQDIVFTARDGRAQGEVELRLPKDPGLSPVLKLNVGFSDGDGSKAALYYPLILPEALRTWLERSIISGRVTEGQVLYHGALANFPFTDGNGQFEVRAHVKGGVLDYLPGWAPLHDIDADLYFTGTSMSITAAHARLRGMEVGRALVAIDDFKAPGGAVVSANARVTGALQEALGVLVDSKTPLFTSLIPAGTSAEGNGSLTLDLRIPARAPQKTNITGFYRFQKNNLELPLRGMRIENIQGGMEFTEDGLSDGKLKARLLGGDVVLEASPATAKAVGARVEARGRVNQAGLAQLLGPALAPSLLGHAHWQLHLQPAHPGFKVRFETDLSDVEMRLPAPFTKAAGEALTLRIAAQPGANGLQMVDLQAANRLQAKLAFRHESPSWKLARGRIGIGEPVTQLPTARGLQLVARLPVLDVDQWTPLLASTTNENAQNDWLDQLNRVTADISALTAAGREFGRLSVDLNKSGTNWRGRLQGDSAAGQVAILQSAPPVQPLIAGQGATPARSSIYLTLEKLVLPSSETTNDPTPPDPRKLPPLSVQSQSFMLAGIHLGALEFSASPVAQGWKIASLKLNRPETKLTASGLWEIDNSGQHNSRLDASLTSTDVGKLLEVLGYPGEIVGGQLSLESNWMWPGVPGEFRLARTDGGFSFALIKGRIPKVSPGAGRLLGALDLRSITRYLSLDFSNVFSKGLTFDRMQAKVAVRQGNAYTRDLAIRTPGADLEVSGRIGLAARDLDLEIGVTPQLMEELALTGGLIGGPVVGAAVMVLHNLIKKPFEESTRIRYTVMGVWKDPVVLRLEPPVAPNDEPQ